MNVDCRRCGQKPAAYPEIRILKDTPELGEALVLPDRLCEACHAANLSEVRDYPDQ